MFSSITEKINKTFNSLIIDDDDDDDVKNKYNINNYSECKFIQKFKKKKLENRLKLYYNIFVKYPDRIPMIVDTKKELILDKNKYIVPKELTIGQFIYMLRKRINMNENNNIYMLCNNQLLVSSHTVAQVYSTNKDDKDGFLYIVIAVENTFGN